MSSSSADDSQGEEFHKEEGGADTYPVKAG
jgi:hypothetical protein